MEGLATSSLFMACHNIGNIVKGLPQISCACSITATFVLCRNLVKVLSCMFDEIIAETEIETPLNQNAKI